MNMHHFLVKVRASVMRVFIVMTGFFVVGMIGYRLYTQWQALQAFDKSIRLLPISVPQEEKLKFEKEHISLESTLTGTFTQILTGGFFFITAYFTWRNIQVSNEKQITERFTQAINQLSSDKIEVRLGGIYALERIAKDSPKDHWTIMEILSSFVRERSSNLAENLSQKEKFPLFKFPISKSLKNDSFNHYKLSTDVQAALTIIGRRSIKLDKPGYQINFLGADLRNADFRNTNFVNVDFSYANFRGVIINNQTKLDEKWMLIWGAVNIGKFGKYQLQNTDLSFADLRGVDFLTANLKGANILNANLQGANFFDTDLSSANLTNANLYQANFHNSDLTETTLINADLSEGTFYLTYFNNAFLSDANLHKASLVYSDLEGCYLSGANLSEANLGLANCQNTDFDHADLSYSNLILVNLNGASLQFANLSHANLSSANLDGADFFNANLSNSNLCNVNFENANSAFWKFCWRLYVSIQESNQLKSEMIDLWISCITSHIIFGTTNFCRADLTGVFLGNACLKGANFEGANFESAQLISTNLSGTKNLTDKQIDSAQLCRTILPKGSKLDPNRDCQELGISVNTDSRK